MRKANDIRPFDVFKGSSIIKQEEIDDLFVAPE